MEPSLSEVHQAADPPQEVDPTGTGTEDIQVTHPPTPIIYNMQQLHHHVFDLMLLMLLFVLVALVPFDEWTPSGTVGS